MASSSYRGHVFISYVREDARAVDELQRVLKAAGVPVWRDTVSLWPGEDWRAKIRDAIAHDALVFIACFSSRSAARQKSYQYAELLLAVDQLRSLRPDTPWLIPVRFDDCDVPDLEVGGGRTLGSIHRADLFGTGRDEATRRLVTVVQRLLGQSTEALSRGNSPRRTQVFNRPSCGVESMAWQPHGDLLATGNGDMSVSLFDMSTLVEYRTLHPWDRSQGILDDAYPNWVYWSPDGRYLASWTSMGCGQSPSVWDSRTGVSQFFDISNEGEWNSVGWRRDGLLRARQERSDQRGERLLTSEGGTVRLISRGPLWSAGWSASEQAFLLGDVTPWGQWDGSKSTRVPVLSGSHCPAVVAWSPDGMRFAIYGDIKRYADGRIEIWETG